MTPPPATFLTEDLCDPCGWRGHGFGLDAEMRGRLATRCFWVTGAGTGFGRAVATSLALLGSRVVLTGRRRAKLEETVDEAARLADVRDRFAVLPLDLRDGSEVDAGRATLQSTAIAGLVHCAAVPPPSDSPAPLLLTDSFSRVLASNLEAAWKAGRAAIETSAPGGTVRAVFYSSGAGWHFTPGAGPYNVSKAGLNSLAASLAAEAAVRHQSVDVQVNTLNPGEARSEMNQGSERSPYTAVPMTLALLAQPPGGPNGRFFHADGQHLPFASAQPWHRPLLPIPPNLPPRLIRSMNGYNIVAYRGTVLGVPQSLGNIDLATDPQLPATVIRSASLEEVERQLMSVRT